MVALEAAEALEAGVGVELEQEVRAIAVTATMTAAASLTGTRSFMVRCLLPTAVTVTCNFVRNQKASEGFFKRWVFVHTRLLVQLSQIAAEVALICGPPEREGTDKRW
jgi:hypothetical protein